MNPSSPVLVLGASGAVGCRLLPLLVAAGMDVIAVSRQPPPRSVAGVTWLQHDLAAGPAPVEAGVLVSAGPLQYACVQARALPRLGRVIALGSASVRFKTASTDPRERELMAALLQAEDALASLCRSRFATLTVLRPTMIYGGPNRNVDRVSEWLTRRRWIPVAGNGLRQPVHARDLAVVIVEVLRIGEGAAGIFELGGGETLSYRDFLRRIASSAGRAPRLVPVPAPILKAGLALARRLGPFRDLSPAMIDRQRMDLVVDDSKARDQLGWNPGPFRP